jgi:hypothetical protein
MAANGLVVGPVKRLALALLCALALVVSLLVAASLPGAPADAAPSPEDPSVPWSSGTALPFSGDEPGDVVVDEAHGHVFVSGGRGSGEVVVTDLDGQGLQPITGLAGAEGLLLSRDGSTLYAALVDDRSVAAVDTATLEVTAHAAGEACPRRLTELGGDVYFTESCDGVDYHLMRMAANGEVSRVAVTGYYDTVLTRGGPIASHPAHPNRLYVADNRYWQNSSSSYKAVIAYDIDPTDRDAVTEARANLAFGNYVTGAEVYDLDLSSDGNQLMVANAAKVTVLLPTTLESRDYAYSQTRGEPVAVTVVGDHLAFSVTGPDPGPDENRVFVYDRADPDGYMRYRRSYFFDTLLQFAPGSVELAGDRLYAVGAAVDGSGRRLFTFTDFANPGPLLRLDDGGTGTHPGEAVRLTGSAKLLDEPLPGRELTVTRSGPDGQVDLPPVTTAADGTFAIDDTPPGLGVYEYTATYHGEPGIAPERVRDPHSVIRIRTSLGSSGETNVPVGGTMTLTGTLLNDEERTPIPDAEIKLTDTHDGTTTTHTTVTDSEGWFTVQVTDVSAGRHVYQFRYEGDDRYAPTTGFEFSRWPTYRVALDVTGPSDPFLMALQPLTLNGRVTRGSGEPLGGTTLRWERSRAETGSVEESGTVVTAADGTFTLETAAGWCGNTRWQFVREADDKHEIGFAEFVVPVFCGQPDMEIATNRASYEYGAEAEIGANMISGAAGTMRLYAQPYGKPRELIAEHPIWQDYPEPDVFAALKVTRNTEVTAQYVPQGGDHNVRYEYAPREITMSVQVSPLMLQSLSGSYAKQGRTHLVRSRVDPRLNLTTKPSLSGQCVRVRVERYSNGAYRFAKLSPCLQLSRTSPATWPLRGDPPAGAKFRLRYEWAGSPAYAPRNATWSYLRFTR